MNNEFISSLTGPEKALYKVGYAFIINNGGTPKEAHQGGLKQIEKIAKLRARAAKGQIINA